MGGPCVFSLKVKKNVLIKVDKNYRKKRICKLKPNEKRKNTRAPHFHISKYASLDYGHL